MGQFDFLLFGRQFDTTNLTYDFDHNKSLWNGLNSTGDFNFFDVNSKDNLTGPEQALFSSAFTQWAEFSVFGFSSANGTDVGDISVYKANITNGARAHAFELDNSVQPVSEKYTGTYNRSEIVINLVGQLSGGFGTWTALHEIGHSLGLSHTDEQAGDSNYDVTKTVMSFFNASGVFFGDVGALNSHWAITPMAYDIAALEQQYGAVMRNDGDGSSYNKTSLGLQGAMTSQTILDTGGVNDIIDLSGVEGNHTIDLRENIDANGAWVDAKTVISRDTNNAGTSEKGQEWIFIARGSVIENATGAAGKDIITGNDVVNIIRGGSDADEIYAGKGDDKLYSEDKLEADLYHGGGNGLSVSDDGFDTLDYEAMSNGVTVEWTNVAAREATAYYTTEDLRGDGSANDTLVSIENLLLTDGQDHVIFPSVPAYQMNLDGRGDVRDIIDFTDASASVNFDLIDKEINIIVTFDNFGHFIGGTGKDTFIDAQGGYKFDGNDGVDTVDYSDHYAKRLTDTGEVIRIRADLAAGKIESALINGGQAEVDEVIDIEGVIGGEQKDIFIGKEGLVGTDFNGRDHGDSRGDLVDFSAYNAGITVTLGGTGTDNSGGTYTLTNIEQVIGTGSVDTITGDASDNWLFGGDGIDTLNGGGGDDHLVGGDGGDTLDGGGGNDIYYFGGAGLWSAGTGDTITDTGGGTDVVYLFGGYRFDPAQFSLSGGTLSINGSISAQGIQFVEYSDTAKFSTARLGAKIEEATLGVVSGTTLNGDGGNNNLSADSSITDVNGYAGNDWLYGGADATLNGGDGEDYLFGSGILNGGSGNDLLDGGSEFVLSSGIDVIRNAGTDSVLTGLSGNYTLYKADNGSLVIDISTSQKVVVIDHFNGKPLGFIGSNSVPISGVENLPTDLDDVISGLADDDIFRAGKGDDVFDGQEGANRYLFNGGDRDSTNIKTTLDTQADTLVFEGMSSNDVTLIRDVSLGNDNLLIRYEQSYAVIHDVLSDEDHANHFQVEFSSGTAVALSSLELTTRGSYNDDVIYGDAPTFSENDIIYAGHGDDTIYGGNGADTIFDEDGDDSIYGGAGADRYEDGLGNDTFYVLATDTVVLNAGANIIQMDDLGDSNSTPSLFGVNVEVSGAASLDSVLFTRSFANDTEGEYFIRYGDNSLFFEDYQDLTGRPDIMLENGSSQHLSQYTLVTDARNDASPLSYSEIVDNLKHNDLFYLGGGDDYLQLTQHDTVYAGGGNDTVSSIAIGSPSDTSLTVYGEGGDDLLTGGQGDDFIYGGDGNDTIILNLNNIAAGDDTVSADDGDDTVYITPNGTGSIAGGSGNDTVSLAFVTTAPASILEINLDNSTASSYSGTISLSGFENVQGSIFADKIIGDDQGNRLDGWGGIDEIEGGDGNDVYLQGQIAGEVTITETSGFDALELQYMSVQQVQDLIITEEGNDLKVVAGQTTFIIKDQLLASTSSNVEEINFADGSTYSLTNYQSWYVSPGGGVSVVNTIVGSSAVEAITGSAGATDAVDYSASAAAVTVNLLGGSGLGGDAQGDTYNSIENIVGSNVSGFGDILIGGFGANVIDGLDGNDTLIGAFGDDILNGGDGDDTYIFNIGDGNNTITDTSGFDTLQLGAGIALGDITFTRIGDDLDVQIASGFLIKDFYAGGNDVVEQITFADQSTFDLTTLLNTAPIAAADSFVGDANADITGNVLADNGNGVDSDPDGDTLSVGAQTITTANGGAVDLLADGSFTYTPGTDYIGADSFTYTLLDDRGGVASGTVNLTLNAVNNAPVLRKDYATIDEDTSVVLNVLSNDYDPDGDDLRVYFVGGATRGTTVINADNTITYTPNADYFGGDVFYYRATDDNGGSKTQRVTITINPVEDEVEPNLAPVLKKDSATVDEDSSVVIDVLANDSDPNGDVLTVTDVDNGYVVINADNTLTYTPDADYHGTESFLYYVSDGNGGTAVQRVNVVINSIADTAADIEGTGRNETLNGGANDDVIAGLGGDDFIYGGDGDDVLYGGEGIDQLYGQGGADTFVFENDSAFTNSDNVQDFSLADGDKIDVSDLISGYDPLSDAISDFVQITDDGPHSTLFVDTDGGADNFAEVATLFNITGLSDEDALETSGNLIAA